jgi:Bacterial protein of unknown function (DUF945)
MVKGKAWWAVWIIAVVGYLAATWATGRIAHNRVNEFVERIEEQFKGYIHVVDRQSTGGFFSSTEDITFGVDNPLYVMLLTTSHAPTQLTFHNDIVHGPLPAFRTVGVARIKSSLVLTDDVRKTLKDLLGTDEPVAVAVTLGWFGKTHIDITSPVMSIKDPNQHMAVEWKGMAIGMDYSEHFDALAMKGNIPGVVITDKSGSEMNLHELNLTANLKHQAEMLYVGGEEFTIASLNFKEAASTTNVDVKDIAYQLKMDSQDDFYSVSAKVGAALVDSQQVKIKDTHFDVAVNHLHVPTLSGIIKTYQEFSTQLRNDVMKTATGSPSASTSAQSTNAQSTSIESTMSKLAPQIIELLKHDPEFVIEHVGFATDNGALKLTGHAYFDGIETADFEPTLDPTKVMKKLRVTADLTFPQSLVDHWPIGMTPDAANQTIKQLETQGFVARQGEQWQSHFEVNQGALTANGKKVGQ